MRKLLVWLLLCNILLAGCGSSNTTSSTSVNNTNNDIKKEADNNQKRSDNNYQNETYDAGENIEETTDEVFVSDFKPGEDNQWQIVGNRSNGPRYKAPFIYQSDWGYYIEGNKLMKQQIDGGEPIIILEEENIRGDFMAIVGDYIYIYPDYTTSSDDTKGVRSYINRIRTDGKIVEKIDTPNRFAFNNGIVVGDRFYYLERVDYSASSYSQQLCYVDTSNNTKNESEIGWPSNYDVDFLGVDSDGLLYFYEIENGMDEGLISKVDINNWTGTYEADFKGVVKSSEHLNPLGVIKGKKYFFIYGEYDTWKIAYHFSILNLETGEIEIDNRIACGDADWLMFEYDHCSNDNKIIINFSEWIDGSYKTDDIYVNKFYVVDCDKLVNGEGLYGDSIIKEEWIEESMLIDYVYNNKLYYSGRKGNDKYSFYRVNFDGSDWTELGYVR